jgi:7-cyano-7-deazaguanine synthase in queuosine biosynthesis
VQAIRSKKIGILFSGGLDSTILLKEISVNRSDDSVLFVLSGLKRKNDEHRIINLVERIDADAEIIFFDVKEQKDISINRKRIQKDLDLEVVYHGKIKDSNSAPRKTGIFHNGVMRPYQYHDKKYIKSLYDKYDCHDLVKLTHSCEEFPACGKCSQCKDREIFTRVELTNKHKEAYRQFYMVKGHVNTSPETAMNSYESYFKRLWREGSDGAPLYDYDVGFEESWQEVLKKYSK